MTRPSNRRGLRILWLAVGLAIVSGATLWFYLAEAQTVHTPITRHVVVDSAKDYNQLAWIADADTVAGRQYYPGEDGGVSYSGVELKTGSVVEQPAAPEGEVVP